jgi:hypothetical protein
LDGYGKERDDLPPEQKYHLILNCAFVYAGERYRELCRTVGAECTVDFDAVRAAIKAQFFDAESGLFANTVQQGGYSQLGNAFALLIGLGDARTVKALKTDGALVPATLSMAGYVYDALLGADFEGNRGFVLDGDYWQFVNFEITKAGDNGMLLSGNYNRIVEMVFNDNQDTGLQLSRYDTNASTVAQWPSYNLVLNCTSKNNCDDATMENADGFAAKLTCGEGNVFDGCMAYNNSDDGWDLYAKTETGPIGVVTIKNSVAFRNGFTEFGEGYGDCDGNGFKLGGAGVGTAHIVENCLAFENLNCGFTDNNNPKLGSLKNCTAYNNGVGGNGKANYMVYRCSSSTKLDNLMSFNDTSKVSDTGAAGIKISNDKFVGVMNNSVYYNGSYYFAKSNVSMTNGAKIGDVVTVQASDFISLSVPKMGTDFHTAWRASDGSIKTGNFAESTGTYAALGYHLDGKGTASALTGQTGAAASQQTTSTTQPATTTKPVTTTTTPTTPANPNLPAVTLSGDANCDGETNAGDAVVQAKQYVGKTVLDSFAELAADTNRNNGIDGGDAVKVTGKYVKWNSYASALN